MCSQSSCGTCQGVTWFGCGAHIPSVLDSVPEDEWCSCGPPVERNGKQYPPGGSLSGMVWGMFGWGGKGGNKKEEL